MLHKKSSLNTIFYFLSVKSAILILLLIASCESQTRESQRENLTPSVTVLSGDVNGVVISKNNKILVIYGHPQDVTIKADSLLLTHCRRDLLWAAKSIIENGAKTYVPAKELDYFIKIDSFWNDFSRLRYGDYNQQTTKYPAKPLNVQHTLQGGDVFNWQDLEFQVINTPGYTRGAISYICQIDGKKIAFTGDLIYGDGKLFDLYSLQDKITDLKIRGYHGFAGRMAELIKSVQVIKSHKPDIIVPSRGPVIRNPESAINKLTDRLQRLYSNYLSTTAYRHYTGIGKQISLAKRVQLDGATIDWMPLAVTKNGSPSWLKHVNNSVLITSKSGTAFLIDCGNKNTYQKLLDNKGVLSHKDIEGIFITHYHNDHTNFIPELVEKYNCPVYAVTERLEDVLNNPQAYRLPAMTYKPIHNITVVPDKHKMQWNEFSFTFYDFPGQTIYHSAVLVENKNDKVFFIGDSFSPTGIDDYCLQNRNIIQDNAGYLFCIDFLRKMPHDVWLVNQHIHKLFRFRPEQLDFMEQKLRERKTILTELSPWEDINYFIDEYWARIYPYGSEVQQGQSCEFAIVIMNHQNENCTYRVKPNVSSTGLSVSPSHKDLTLSAKQEGMVTFSLSTSHSLDTGLHIITADIIYNDKNLHEWCEGIIQVK